MQVSSGAGARDEHDDNGDEENDNDDEMTKHEMLIEIIDLDGDATIVFV